MDVSAPHRAVVASLDGDVLVLLARTRQPLSGREIADRLGHRSHDGVRKSLERLVRQGIVLREASRSAYFHVLNGEHVATAAVLELAGIRTELWKRLRREIGGWAIAPVHASVFGSTARGDGDEQSDIDIFIVREAAVGEDDPTWLRQVERLRERIESWTGNRAGIVEQDEQSLGKLLARAKPPAALGEVARDGIDLAGIPTRKLLGALRAA